MVYRIEKQLQTGEWRVSSTFSEAYPLVAIVDVARDIRRILVVRVTRAADAVSAPAEVIWDGAK